MHTHNFNLIQSALDLSFHKMPVNIIKKTWNGWKYPDSFVLPKLWYRTICAILRTYFLYQEVKRTTVLSSIQQPFHIGHTCPRHYASIHSTYHYHFWDKDNCDSPIMAWLSQTSVQVEEEKRCGAKYIQWDYGFFLRHTLILPKSVKVVREEIYSFKSCFSLTWLPSIRIDQRGCEWKLTPYY